MLYHLSFVLKQYIHSFNVVHYVSFRIIAALLSTLFFMLAFGGWFIGKSQKLFRSKARSSTPERHRQKDNMPTMGGLFILSVVIINILLWCNLVQPHVWIFLIGLIGFGIIGCIDDWAKIRTNTGISVLYKATGQLVVGLLVACLMAYCLGTNFSTIPFSKVSMPNLGWWYIVWAAFVIIGCSNAVNLTDGLDGLAIGSLIPNFATFAILCYLAGHYAFATYLHIPFTGSSEVSVIGGTLVGASLGFLWYNTYPAQIFMGDVGSLALGCGLAMMALMARQELLLILSGGLFVVETISVIVQVIAYKFFGKRVFKMAPIHHHFELLGWQESKITVRFCIISLVLCLLALITIKIR